MTKKTLAKGEWCSGVIFGLNTALAIIRRKR